VNDGTPGDGETVGEEIGFTEDDFKKITDFTAADSTPCAILVFAMSNKEDADGSRAFSSRIGFPGDMEPAAKIQLLGLIIQEVNLLQQNLLASLDPEPEEGESS
jgi:hypothetical protein